MDGIERIGMNGWRIHGVWIHSGLGDTLQFNSIQFNTYNTRTHIHMNGREKSLIIVYILRYESMLFTNGQTAR